MTMTFEKTLNFRLWEEMRKNGKFSDEGKKDSGLCVEFSEKWQKIFLSSLWNGEKFSAFFQLTNNKKTERKHIFLPIPCGIPHIYSCKFYYSTFEHEHPLPPTPTNPATPVDFAFRVARGIANKGNNKRRENLLRLREIRASIPPTMTHKMKNCIWKSDK